MTVEELQEIRQEIIDIPMTIQRTRCFNEREISDYRSDVLEVIDKHIREITDHGGVDHDQ